MKIPRNLPAVILEFCYRSGDILLEDCHFGALPTLLNLSPEQIKEQPDGFFACAQTPKFKALLSAALTQQHNFEIELHLRNPADQDFWFQFAFSPSGNTSGSACMIDITFKHNQRENAKLSAEFFHRMQDQLEDLFYFKDRNSRILGGNKAFYEYHGASCIEELIGTTDLDSKRLPEDVKQEIFDAEQKIMESGGIWRRREHNWDQNGVEHYYESIKTPNTDSSGRVIGLVGITREITDQVYAEQALKKAKADAELASKAKSAFLAVMSHEIRTPMNGVIGCASLLDDSPLDETQRQLVQTIITSGDALLILINDILDYSKIEAGKFELETGEFELREVVENCLELFSKDAADKRLEMNALIAPEIPTTLLGDAARLRQVICNLISNAIKFTPEGEIFIQISLAELNKEKSDCKILVKVKDTGIGIPDEKKSRLFNAFTQADSSVTRRFGGTGLGLVICKKLINLMGGEIFFDSKEDKGTTFTIGLTLPYTETHPKPEHEWIRSCLAEKNVLIIDDNATNRMVLEKLCEQIGMHSKTVCNAKSALEFMEHSAQLDLILLDFCMPHFHGGDFAKEVKEISKHARTPIILLSSIHTPNEYRKYVNACLLKPVSSRRLEETMFSIITGQSNRQNRHFKIFTPKATEILIAEDNPVNKMVLISMLHKLGYENIEAVDNGKDAVERFQKKRHKLVFMDMQMPIMDGLEATQKIRSVPSQSKPWIIALTAAALKEDELKAYQAGVSDYASKPITLDSLCEVLMHAEDALLGHN